MELSLHSYVYVIPAIIRRHTIYLFIMASCRLFVKMPLTKLRKYERMQYMDHHTHTHTHIAQMSKTQPFQNIIRIYRFQVQFVRFAVNRKICVQIVAFNRLKKSMHFQLW